MKNKKSIEQAEKYIERFYNKTLGVDIVKALRYKWFRLNTIYFVKDKEGRKVRFRPNRAQYEFFQSRHGNDLILKARQLGFTTNQMIDDLDECLFSDNYSAGCIAHNDKAAKDIFRNKVKFAYENITENFKAIFSEISNGLPKPLNDRDGQYLFDNGSSISVSTGYRGGTLQSLHVSEFGKICKKRPDIAEEIVTGAFQAVSKTGRKTIESTAEGKEGYFYDYCSEAEKRQKQGKEPVSVQFKLHFFPWFDEPEYFIDEDVEISERLNNYFTELESKHGIKLSDGQKRFYALKELELGEKIKQEYPSTPEEAFSSSVDGAYYSAQFNKIYEQKRIGKMPINDAPVHTAWDLGVGDSTVIWFYQKIGDKYHIIDYYENSGEGLAHYAKILKSKGYNYGTHYAPHDIDHREFGSEAKTRKDQAAEGYEIDGKIYKIKFTVVPKISIDDGIELVREILDICCFSSALEDSGIKCLENYRKEWNDKLGCYRDRPLHDWSSHAADAFRYLAVAELKKNTVRGKIKGFRI